MNNLSEAVEVDVVIGAFMFITNDDFEFLNGFDERFEFYHEDTDLCYRIKKQGGKIYYLPNTSLIHIGGGTSKRYLWFHYKKRSESLIKFVQKHYTGFQFVICILFHYIGMLIRIPILIFLGIVIWEKNLILRGIYSIFTLFIYPKNAFKNKSTNHLS
jgi:GT2 family glycosyltransferase